MYAFLPIGAYTRNQNLPSNAGKSGITTITLKVVPSLQKNKQKKNKQEQEQITKQKQRHQFDFYVFWVRNLLRLRIFAKMRNAARTTAPVMVNKTTQTT